MLFTGSWILILWEHDTYCISGMKLPYWQWNLKQVVFEKYLYYSSWFSLSSSSSYSVFFSASLLSSSFHLTWSSPYGPILSTGHVQCITFSPCTELFQMTLTVLPLISVIKHFSSTKTYKEISLLRYNQNLLYCIVTFMVLLKRHFDNHL